MIEKIKDKLKIINNLYLFIIVLIAITLMLFDEGIIKIILNSLFFIVTIARSIIGIWEVQSKRYQVVLLILLIIVATFIFVNFLHKQIPSL